MARRCGVNYSLFSINWLVLWGGLRKMNHGHRVWRSAGAPCGSVRPAVVHLFWGPISRPSGCWFALHHGEPGSPALGRGSRVFCDAGPRDLATWPACGGAPCWAGSEDIGNNGDGTGRAGALPLGGPPGDEHVRRRGVRGGKQRPALAGLKGQHRELRHQVTGNTKGE